MPRTNFNELLEAGVHFGHLKRKWNPNMAPYIFMERNEIHIIDLHKTIVKLDEAANAAKQIAKSGRKILFVATKKQAKDLVAERVKEIKMPYITERWSGGTLTNFPTIRKAVKKMQSIDKQLNDGTFERLSKRERLQIERQRAKLEKTLGSISDLTRLPAALFAVDVSKEYIAVHEANKLNIPVFGIVDTNSDPIPVDFPIPANDDASKSIDLVMNVVCKAIEEGLEERKAEKEKSAAEKKEKSPKEQKSERPRTTKKSAAKVERPGENEEKTDTTTDTPEASGEKNTEEKPGKTEENK
ncbi:MAG: 30S ribosomal protein S2 [Bacteroidota bacterium]|nr:30S ribosomal protein S2 [Bacteroidota bacterium]